jgi:exodeoxyribonuclease VII large subunit
VAEELTARFVQMRRQLDEATNTLKTVWGYRLRMNQDYLNRAITGIQQGARKLLEVTSSNLREQAQELRIRVKNRITIEKINISGKKERISSRPAAIFHNHRERISSKRQNLETRTRFFLSSAVTTFSGMKQRFDRERFLRRVKSDLDNLNKSLLQMKSRFIAQLRSRIVQQTAFKDRFKLEKIQYRINTERKSLNEKMATIKASDPQNALQRGFSLVYSQNGALVRSLNDIYEKDILRTRLADGTVISEVTAKEVNQ